MRAHPTSGSTSRSSRATRRISSRWPTPSGQADGRASTCGAAGAACAERGVGGDRIDARTAGGGDGGGDGGG